MQHGYGSYGHTRFVEPEQYEYFQGEWERTDPNYAVTYHYYGTAKGYKQGTWTVFTSAFIAAENKLKWIRLKNFDDPLKARAYMDKRVQHGGQG